MVYVGLALVVLLGLALVATVMAQPAGEQQGQRGQMMRGRGQRMGRMMRMPMRMPMLPVAIAVANGKVFVASAGKLYRFNADTLELEMEASYGPPAPAPGPQPMPQPQPLPAPQPPGRGGGGQ